MQAIIPTFKNAKTEKACRARAVLIESTEELDAARDADNWCNRFTRAITVVRRVA
jgi:hypothetical protein